MIIYNVTSNVDNTIQEKWMAWMMEDHIPKIMEIGKFYKIKIVKVLTDHHDEGTTTYSVQYFADSREKLNEYYNDHSPKLRAESAGLFGDKVLQFRTELEIIQEFKSV
ncbi:DUF4286 family protein [Flavobacterium subsaxonicum]|uniref:DUF4286 domain-containing protein n=1 Tax=Flavobacterium subsaxonicum WB 4.1-42 = DSM 21790 TaxID=1121898 RepID=A0A0A2MIB5_9FLAO|nr:DUF4286 family protein [Flavobacterium subsaxonicum]KGO91163.1 hypothetical protein Q766_19565 [Flavobacterium subsaxonicum WB 4.1-42 = DSM 21790]